MSAGICPEIMVFFPVCMNLPKQIIQSNNMDEIAVVFDISDNCFHLRLA
jgi:hypothetical protein